MVEVVVTILSIVMSVSSIMVGVSSIVVSIFSIVVDILISMEVMVRWESVAWHIFIVHPVVVVMITCI